MLSMDFLHGEKRFEKRCKHARNKTNKAIKKAKRKYFSEKLDVNKGAHRKTWRLSNMNFNGLQSRQSKSYFLLTYLLVSGHV